MRQPNPFLKEKLKNQFLQPITKCELHQAFCRFAIPGYCLVEHHLLFCNYGRVLEKSATFKPKRKESQS